jgi:hypothetical protein
MGKEENIMKKMILFSLLAVLAGQLYGADSSSRPTPLYLKIMGHINMSRPDELTKEIEKVKDKSSLLNYEWTVHKPDYTATPLGNAFKVYGEDPSDEQAAEVIVHLLKSGARHIPRFDEEDLEAAGTISDFYKKHSNKL